VNEGIAIAVLGLGEAGSLLARDLVDAGADVRGFDPRVAVPPGVAARTGDADAVRDAAVVLSVTSAHDAVDALTAALPQLRPGTVWADLNTTSPGLKQRLATLAGSRADVVDVALMSPVPGRGLRTPMVASGPAAPRFAQLLVPLGAQIQLLPGPVGAAMSRKLLRSVFYKGLAAAVVEALTAARAAGCEDWLRQNIADELTGFDANTIERLVDGSTRHARRRAEEMAASAEQLRELGVAPRVASAAQELLADLAAAAADLPVAGAGPA
jgi:3-hydroxyisobutyrate dehydrogenase-like beta-hydroxyacid dehydrogenase